MQLTVAIGSLAGAAAVLAWRLRETQRPVTARTIIIPPLAMSTGFAMFLYPPTRIPWSWALCAYAIGAIFLAYPLIKSSKLERQGDLIMLRRSRAFLGIFLGLLAIRLVARDYVGRFVSPLQTGAVFFVLAFGMISRWRIHMYREFQQRFSET